MDLGQRSSAPDTAPDALDATGTLGRLTAVLNTRQTVELTPTDIVTIARDSLPGADEVSITISDEGPPSTIASTGPIAIEMDEWQYDVRGPCLDAAQDSSLLVCDVSTDTCWPDYDRRAQEVGIAS